MKTFIISLVVAIIVAAGAFYAGIQYTVSGGVSASLPQTQGQVTSVSPDGIITLTLLDGSTARAAVTGDTRIFDITPITTGTLADIVPGVSVNVFSSTTDMSGNAAAQIIQVFSAPFATSTVE